MYCAWRIPAHLRCTQCSIMLHLMDICFLTCICLWQISQIQTCLFKVVGPGLVSTSPAFVSSSASHPAGLHGRHAQKIGWGGPTQFAQQLESTVTAPPLVDCVVWSMNVLRTSHLKPNSIGRVPVNGYRSLRNYSNNSMEWITYCKKNNWCFLPPRLVCWR